MKVFFLFLLSGVALVKCQSKTSSPESQTHKPNIRCLQKQQTKKCGRDKYTVKYYYSTTSLKCVRFWYGNCPDVLNVFDTRKHCLYYCNRVKYNKHVKQEQIRRSYAHTYRRNRSRHHSATPERNVTNVTIPKPLAYTDPCGLEGARGECTDYEIRWKYNSRFGRCDRFWFGGCGGNTNNFEDKDSCEKRCGKTGQSALLYFFLFCKPRLFYTN